MANIRKRNNDLMTFGDSLFDSFFSSPNMANKFTVDIKETDQGYELKADLPGFNKEDLNVSYDDNVLTIEALHKAEDEERDEEERYLRRERSTASFRRQFLIKDLDRENISAKFENGVLTLALPTETETKKEEARIEIE